MPAHHNNYAHPSARGRTRLLAVFVLLVGMIIVLKLGLVQIIQAREFKELAERQYVQDDPNRFDRGTIFFETKDGNKVSAAVTYSGFKAVADPAKVTDEKAACAAIAAALSKPDGLIDDCEIRLTKKTDRYEELAHHIEEPAAQSLVAQKIPGITLNREEWRYAPGQKLAAHLIGFVGSNGNEVAGRYGIERSYDALLQRSSQDLYVNFFAQAFAKIREFTKPDTDDMPDGNVVTTIEPNVQSHLETALDSMVEKWHPDQIGGLVIDPNTGAIKALAVRPTFDVNNFREASSNAVYTNPFVENVFEMGSIVKPIIMAVGIDAGKITPQTPFYDPGFVKVGPTTIHNFDNKGRGQITMTEVLSNSLNTGMVKVSQLVPKATMKSYLLHFGLGEKTGIDLPSETKGLLSNLNTNRDIEYANMSFGQGIAVTPIEIVRALSAIANGGYLVIPHTVDRIEYDYGFTKKMEYPKGDQIISAKTAEDVTRMMTHVVDDVVDGGHSKFEHYTVAAKTGTAQVPAPNGGYYDDRNLHSFVGFFPAYDPKFLIFFYMVYPKGVKYASQSIAPDFFQLSDFLIHYYEIPPDR